MPTAPSMHESWMNEEDRVGGSLSAGLTWFFVEFGSGYAQRRTPLAHRQSPQTGKGLPWQSFSFFSESSQPPQSTQGENSNLLTLSRNAA